MTAPRRPKRGDWSYNNYLSEIEVWDGADWRRYTPEDLRCRGINDPEQLERTLARSELTIKLISYNDDPEKYAAIVEAARDAARTLITVAMMLQDKRTPEVSMFNDDFFEGTKEILVDVEGGSSDA